MHPLDTITRTELIRTGIVIGIGILMGLTVKWIWGM